MSHGDYHARMGSIWGSELFRAKKLLADYRQQKVFFAEQGAVSLMAEDRILTMTDVVGLLGLDILTHTHLLDIPSSDKWYSPVLDKPI